MGFVCTLIVVAIAIIAFVVWMNEDAECLSIWLFCILVFVAGLVKLASYGSYIRMQSSTIELTQDVEALKIYKQYALQDLAKETGSPSTASLTDTKYQHFQTEISNKIEGLRQRVNTYNSTVIGKRKMCSSWYWRYLIVPPDEEMQIFELNKLFE